MELTARKKEILKVVIEHYISTAEPVGSKTIAQEMEASRYHIRTPAFWDGLPGSYTQAFGMIKWYDSALHGKYFAQQDAYLGLGFD